MKPDAELISGLAEIFDVPQEKRSSMQKKPLLLLEDIIRGEVLLAVVEPCACLPADGATRFPADDKTCKDASAAQKIIDAYEDLRLDSPQEAEKLAAADLNNVAGAYLWRGGEADDSAVKAYNLLKLARVGAAGNTLDIIEKNIKRLEAIKPDVPRLLAVFEHNLYRIIGRTLDEVRPWMVERADLKGK